MYRDDDQKDFELRPLACKNVTTALTGLKSVPSSQTRHIILTHYPCEIVTKKLYVICLRKEITCAY